jgi:rhamnosyltransferase subunit B
MSHVLLAAFGSAGDLFPSIAVARALQEQGHRATILAPRTAGFYARAAGVPSAAIGEGAELRVIADDSIYTTRFDGFDSWRQTATNYLHPILAEGYDRARTVVERLAPDVIAVHPLAPFGSLLATELDIPWASVHLYPQLSPAARSRRPGRWGGPLVDWFHQTERRLGVESWGHPLLRWGWADTNLSVHDAALVDATPLAHLPIGEPCGFPYWDDVPVPTAEREALARAIEPGDPLVVVTLGSFIGHGRVPFWRRLGAALRTRRWPALLLGVPPELRAELEGPGVTCAGFVPMSSVIGHARLLVHHGGIGTTYAGLQAGVPAAVVPQAFDQTFNGRLVVAARAGALVAPDTDLAAMLAELDGDGEVHARTKELAAAMVAPHHAAANIAARLVELGGRA